MAGLWRAYSRFVDKFPWGSQILQTGVLCASGDVIAQVECQGVGKKELYNFLNEGFGGEKKTGGF